MAAKSDDALLAAGAVYLANWPACHRNGSQRLDLLNTLAPANPSKSSWKVAEAADQEM